MACRSMRDDFRLDDHHLQVGVGGWTAILRVAFFTVLAMLVWIIGYVTVSAIVTFFFHLRMYPFN